MKNKSIIQREDKRIFHSQVIYLHLPISLSLTSLHFSVPEFLPITELTKELYTLLTLAWLSVVSTRPPEKKGTAQAAHTSSHLE